MRYPAGILSLVIHEDVLLGASSPSIAGSRLTVRVLSYRSCLGESVPWQQSIVFGALHAPSLPW